MSNHSFYVSSSWQHAREKSLRHYHYEDQEAKQYGQTVTATMVHHIYPLLDYPELRLQPWNLLPLSNKSHERMHKRDSDELTERGKYWQAKRRREFRAFYANHGDPPTMEKLRKLAGDRGMGVLSKHAEV